MVSICSKEKFPWWWVRTILITEDRELRASGEPEHMTFVFQGRSCLTNVFFSSCVHPPAWLMISFFLTAEQHSIVCATTLSLSTHPQKEIKLFPFLMLFNQSSNEHDWVKIHRVGCRVLSADAKGWYNWVFGEISFYNSEDSPHWFTERLEQFAIPRAVRETSLQLLELHVLLISVMLTGVK